LSLKQVDLRDMFKKASRSACTLNVTVSPDTLSLMPSTSGVCRLQKKKEEDPSDPELAA